jgi:hypothetical protein
MNSIQICCSCTKEFDFGAANNPDLEVLKANVEILKEYPIQDIVWPSRRWNKEGGHSDMSGGEPDAFICQPCYDVVFKEHNEEINRLRAIE